MPTEEERRQYTEGVPCKVELPASTLARVNAKLDEIEKVVGNAEVPFTCDVCDKSKHGFDRAAGSPLNNVPGPIVCNECAYEGLLWAAIQAKQTKDGVLAAHEGRECLK